MAIYFYHTKIGKIGIEEQDNVITNLYFEYDKVSSLSEICETQLIKEAAKQLEEYLEGTRQSFTIPLRPEGTSFMQEIWQLLTLIPYGQTASYKEIAIKANRPKAARAVGLANNRNPIPIFIPCHRVIGQDGTLTGYRGGLETKKTLLQMENYFNK